MGWAGFCGGCWRGCWCIATAITFHCHGVNHLGAIRRGDGELHGLAVVACHCRVWTDAGTVGLYAGDQAGDCGARFFGGQVNGDVLSADGAFDAVDFKICVNFGAVRTAASSQKSKGNARRD